MFTASILAVTITSAPLTTRNMAIASYRFGVKLLKGMGQGKNNFMISPASVYTVMALVSMGTSGATEQEALKTLGLSGSLRTEQLAGIGELIKSLESGDPRAKSVLANSLWLSSDFHVHPNFIKEVEPAFRAEVETVDFGSNDAPRRINRWVADKTTNRIKELFKRISPQTAAVLVSAIWFRGISSEAFQKADTKPRQFTLAGGKNVKAPAMILSGMRMYGETEAARLAELRYGNGRFAMVVGLPKGGRDPQAALAVSLGQIKPLGSTDVNLQLPKWTSRFRWDNAIPILRKTGFNRIFDGRQAEFSRMTPERVFISQVVHESWIQVNEEGTEAAAATGVELTKSRPVAPRRVDFIVDRPFFYMIRDTHTGLITFAGVVRDPRA